jgi:hypothetical protein
MALRSFFLKRFLFLVSIRNLQFLNMAPGNHLEVKFPRATRHLSL